MAEIDVSNNRKGRSAAIAPANTPQKPFSEKSFVDTVCRLCKENMHEEAARFYIDNVSRFMDLRINAKEKLNHLMFLPRLIQSGAATKHGYAKLLNKAAIVEAALEGHNVPKNGGFIDLGCGAHDPLALASYYYLNGFTKCYGIDLLQPRTSQYSAISMYDILANARTFPKKYCRAGTDPADIIKRLRPFKVGAFENGNFEAGFSDLKGTVEFRSEDICVSPIEKASISLLVSFAVLEHVTDIDGVSNAIYGLLKPGGYAFHFVDLQDHRSYSSAKQFAPLSFLTEEDAPANMNRLRAPEISEASQRAGFEILRDKRTNVDVTEDILTRVVNRFRRFTPAELGAVKQVLLLRKPA